MSAHYDGRICKPGVLLWHKRIANRTIEYSEKLPTHERQLPWQNLRSRCVAIRTRNALRHVAQNGVAWLDGFITLLWLEFEVLSIHNLLTSNLAEFAKHVHGYIIPSVETASIDKNYPPAARSEACGKCVGKTAARNEASGNYPPAHAPRGAPDTYMQVDRLVSLLVEHTLDRQLEFLLFLHRRELCLEVSENVRLQKCRRVKKQLGAHKKSEIFWASLHLHDRTLLAFRFAITGHDLEHVLTALAGFCQSQFGRKANILLGLLPAFLWVFPGQRRACPGQLRLSEWPTRPRC